MIQSNDITTIMLSFILGLILYLIKLYKDLVKEQAFLKEKIVKIEGAIDILIRAINNNEKRGEK